MSRAGWYPDPGGAPGMYRYWDGTAWAPTVVAGPPAAPPGAPGWSGGQPLPTRPPTPGPDQRATQSRRGSGLQGLAWWGLILGVIVGLIFGGSQLLRAVGFDPFNPAPNSNPTANPCPAPNPAAATIPPRVTADGRVQGGQLSYPMLPEPWSAPNIEYRLPFGRGVVTQIVTVEPAYRPDASWVASVVVGELVAGDGFIAPREGIEIVTRCALATFYDDAVVTRDDRTNRSVTIDGKPGWLLETHLSFDIPGLNEKGETAIFLIVQTSDTSSSIFYASIPDSRPELLENAREAQELLRVEA
nr:DUF2510 domain-containing protein [Propionibacterium sp.]